MKRGSSPEGMLALPSMSGGWDACARGTGLGRVKKRGRR